MIFPTLVQVIFLFALSLGGALINIVGGGGSGTIILPSLVLVFSQHPSVLIGSIFFMYLVVTLTGYAIYSRRRLVNQKSGLILSVPCIPGIVLGTLLNNSISSTQFKIGLGIVTLVFATLIFMSSNESGNKKPDEQSDSVIRLQENSDALTYDLKEKSAAVQKAFALNKNTLIKGLAIMFGASLLNGMFGAGASLVIVPSMILIMKLPSLTALATGQLVLSILNLSGFVVHIGMSAVDYPFAAILGIGAMAGSYLGTRLVLRLSPTRLRKAMSILLIVIATALIAPVAVAIL